MVVDSTIYGTTRQKSSERFASHIEGPVSAFFLVLAESELQKPAREALDKSAQALGWKEGATFVWMTNKSTEPSSHSLSVADVYEVIEGLDPLCVVLVGTQACEAAAEAFQCTVPTQGHFRLFGREACAFNHLEGLLETAAGKQSVWALLRALPKAPR